MYLKAKAIFYYYIGSFYTSVSSQGFKNISIGLISEDSQLIGIHIKPFTWAPNVAA